MGWHHGSQLLHVLNDFYFILQFQKRSDDDWVGAVIGCWGGGWVWWATGVNKDDDGVPEDAALNPADIQSNVLLALLKLLFWVGAESPDGNWAKDVNPVDGMGPAGDGMADGTPDKPMNGFTDDEPTAGGNDDGKDDRSEDGAPELNLGSKSGLGMMELLVAAEGKSAGCWFRAPPVLMGPAIQLFKRDELRFREFSWELTGAGWGAGDAVRKGFVVTGTDAGPDDDWFITPNGDEWLLLLLETNWLNPAERGLWGVKSIFSAASPADGVWDDNPPPKPPVTSGLRLGTAGVGAALKNGMELFVPPDDDSYSLRMDCVSSFLPAAESNFWLKNSASSSATPGFGNPDADPPAPDERREAPPAPFEKAQETSSTDADLSWLLTPDAETKASKGSLSSDTLFPDDKSWFWFKMLDVAGDDDPDACWPSPKLMPSRSLWLLDPLMMGEGDDPFVLGTFSADIIVEAGFEMGLGTDVWLDAWTSAKLIPEFPRPIFLVTDVCLFFSLDFRTSSSASNCIVSLDRVESLDALIVKECNLRLVVEWEV